VDQKGGAGIVAGAALLASGGGTGTVSRRARSVCRLVACTGGESMSVDGARLRRAGAIAVIGLLSAVSAFAAASASAETWTGSAHGKIVRSNRLVNSGTTWRGHFWFRTNGNGAARGRAVVGYEPSVDASGLNSAIAYVKSAAGTALGLLGPFSSAASGVGLARIVGVGASFGSAMAVRRGPLSGRLKGDRLTLRWDTKLAGIPYDINLQLVSGSKRIGGGRATLQSPFTGPADLFDGRDAVYTSESRSTDGGVTQTIGSYRVAHRID
jgi:hypothetical protein